MTNQAQDTPAHQIILADMDAWEAFAAANAEALVEVYGSTAKAYQHAVQGGLTLGGGAAPLFEISFADDLPDTIWTYDANGNRLWGRPNFAKPGVAEAVERAAFYGELASCASRTVMPVVQMARINRFEEGLAP